MYTVNAPVHADEVLASFERLDVLFTALSLGIPQDVAALDSLCLKARITRAVPHVAGQPLCGAGRPRLSPLRT